MSTEKAELSTRPNLFQTSTDLDIKIVYTPEEAQALVKKGYTPVECSFGGNRSVVDGDCFDHHGKYSDLDGVAIRAYSREHFGSRRERPWFVSTGFPDEDATFAIASLAGIIPHPSLADMYSDAPKALRRMCRQDFSEVGRLINMADINPDAAITLVDTYWGRLVMLWRQLAHPTCADLVAWYQGVGRWRSLLTSVSDVLIEDVREVQQDEMDEVLTAPSHRTSKHVSVVDFSALGRNSRFYQAWLDTGIDLLVAFIGDGEGAGVCSFVGNGMKRVTALLGERGFIEWYPVLQPEGCGGREIIGGSSREQRVTWQHALEYGAQLDRIINERKAAAKPAARKRATKTTKKRV